MPVLMCGPNGTLIHKSSMAVAVAGADAADNTMIVTTDQTIVGLTIPATIALVVTNGAVITVEAYLAILGEFTKPHYDCFAGAGTITLPTTGPGPTQNFDVKGLTLAGPVNEAQGTNIASATTTDIGAATGNYVTVSGATTITGLGTVQAGTRRTVNFTGALILTYNATKLILPSAANITTVAGDIAAFISLGSGNWVCTQYQRAAFVPYPRFIQRVEATPYATRSTISTIIPRDDTIPQNTEGAEIITVTITPKVATSRLVIEFSGNAAATATANHAVTALFQDTTAGALAATAAASTAAGYMVPLVLRHEMQASTLVATTFKIRVGPDVSAIEVNGSSFARVFGGVAACRLSVTEVI